MIDIKNLLEKNIDFAPSKIINKLYYYNFENISNKLLLSQDELLKIQNKKLEKILNKASKLPFYKKFDCKPDDLDSFPVLTKQDFIGNYDDIIIKNPFNIKTATSGSSGEPFIFSRHINDVRKERLYVLRNFVRHGYKKGDAIGALRSFIPKHNEETMKTTSLQNITWFSAYHLDNKNTKKYADNIIKNEIRFMFSYPSSFYLFARYCIDNRIEIPNLKAVFLSSEKMLQEWYSAIKKAFPGTEIIDRYGTAELSNSFTFCSTCNGYHINEDYAYTELIPIEGQNKKFEIVGTGFLNTSFPMVRYNMKDIFRLEGIIDSKCNYGSKVYLGEIEGRSTDFLYSDGKYLPGVNFFTLFHHYEKEIKQFQILQSKEDLLTIKLVLNNKKSDPLNLQNDIDQALRLRVGQNIKIEYEYHDFIERDPISGKYKNIISKIN